jgi:hydrogenase/urease accessory protein HupE
VRLRCLLVLAALLWGGAPALAHELRPALLQVTETGAGAYEVLWKRPQRGDLTLGLRVAWPEGCDELAPPAAQLVPGAMVERRLLACDGPGLMGRRIAIDGLAGSTTDVLVRIELVDGRVETGLLKPTSPVFEVQGPRPALALAADYLIMGIQHILLGVDHLLFVLGLLLIVGNRWLLVKTITAFTAAHSLTLAIATLGYANAPEAPLNALIALSILFLGPEIVRAWRGESSFTIRHPWAVAGAFGLLHGFGFATGLSAAGIPPAEIPFALLLFNLGVEVGQLGFVALVLLLARSLRILELRWPRPAELVPGYVVGALGACWTIQGTAVLIGGTT